MILLALGANLPSERFGSPLRTLEATLALLEARGIGLAARSRWYESAPLPPSAQPWYVNGVAVLSTALEPGPLLTLCHGVEAELGRVRGEANAARPVDLDLLDYQGHVSRPGEWPALPHPRMQERAFVLLPLAEVAPAWRHPVTGANLAELMVALPPNQICRPLAAA